MTAMSILQAQQLWDVVFAQEMGGPPIWEKFHDVFLLGRKRCINVEFLLESPHDGVHKPATMCLKGGKKTHSTIACCQTWVSSGKTIRLLGCSLLDPSSPQDLLEYIPLDIRNQEETNIQYQTEHRRKTRKRTRSAFRSEEGGNLPQTRRSTTKLRDWSGHS